MVMALENGGACAGFELVVAARSGLAVGFPVSVSCMSCEFSFIPFTTLSSSKPLLTFDLITSSSFSSSSESESDSEVVGSESESSDCKVGEEGGRRREASCRVEGDRAGTTPWELAGLDWIEGDVSDSLSPEEEFEEESESEELEESLEVSSSSCCCAGLFGTELPVGGLRIGLHLVAAADELEQEEDEV